MKLRSILIFVLAMTAIWLLICSIGGVLAMEGALHPQHRMVSAEDVRRATDAAEREDAELQEEQISAADGAVLRGWSLRPHHSNGDAVILLHGQGDNRAGMLGPAEMLVRHGLLVLLPDARAHGQSGGAIATYGVLEADDVRRWFDWLMQSQSPHCIDGVGDSMGGAELLRSLDEEHGFCAVVAESSFATFQEAAYDRLGQQFSVGPWLGRTVLRPRSTLVFSMHGSGTTSTWTRRTQRNLFAKQVFQ